MRSVSFWIMESVDGRYCVLKSKGRKSYLLSSYSTRERAKEALQMILSGSAHAGQGSLVKPEDIGTCGRLIVARTC